MVASFRFFIQILCLFQKQHHYHIAEHCGMKERRSARRTAQQHTHRNLSSCKGIKVELAMKEKQKERKEGYWTDLERSCLFSSDMLVNGKEHNFNQRTLCLLSAQQYKRHCQSHMLEASGALLRRHDLFVHMQRWPFSFSYEFAGSFMSWITTIIKSFFEVKKSVEQSGWLTEWAALWHSDFCWYYCSLVSVCVGVLFLVNIWMLSLT